MGDDSKNLNIRLNLCDFACLPVRLGVGRRMMMMPVGQNTNEDLKRYLKTVMLTVSITSEMSRNVAVSNTSNGGRWRRTTASIGDGGEFKNPNKLGGQS